MNYNDEIPNVHALHMHGISSILIIIFHYIPFLKSKLYLKFNFKAIYPCMLLYTKIISFLNSFGNYLSLWFMGWGTGSFYIHNKSSNICIAKSQKKRRKEERLKNQKEHCWKISYLANYTNL